MQYAIFLFYVLILMASVMGCESQNPICNDQFCVDGRIFSRAEIGTQPFDEVNVNTTDLLAAIGEIPSVESDALSAVIADVESGGTAYLDETITQRVTVSGDHAEFENKGYITIIIPSYLSEFYITDAGTPSNMDMFKKGWQYDVTLEIYRITKFNESEGYQILSIVVDYTDVIETPPTVMNAEIDDITDDVSSGGFLYLGKTIQVLGVVNWVSDSGDAITISEDGSLHDTVSFFIFSHSDPALLAGYSHGDEDTFTVFINHIVPPGTGSSDNFSIYSEFIELN